MSLSTHSKFYFNYVVTPEEQNIDFSEGGPELTAELPIGAYTLTDFLNVLETALNDAGALTYTVSVNRATRLVTIAATGNFELLVSTGSHQGTTAFGLAGFTGADRTGAATYLGNSGAGEEYVTQFILQSHVGSEDFQDSTYGTVNKSASGKIEVVSYGLEKFVEFNLRYVNNYNQLGGFIRSDATGVDKLRAFMQYLTTKAPLEFMPDENTPATFESLILESTPDDSKGLKYKLREQYGQGLPGFFETGVLKFRVID